MPLIKRLLFPALLLILVLPLRAQMLIYPERSYQQATELNTPSSLTARHLSVKPYIANDPDEYDRIDSTMVPGALVSGKGRSWIIRKIFFEPFLKADTARFFIAADPLFDLQLGYDLSSKSTLYCNSRGLQISGHFSDKLAFYTSYLESQARFPSYITDYIRHYDVVPGMNRVKDFKGNSYDYGQASANISYSPWKFLNLQLGYGKNFFGSGYRSLLLSDNAFNYPFIKITTKIGRFEYVNLITSFQNLDSDSVLDAPNIWYQGYQKKGGTFNYLSVHITRWLDLAIFEGIIWKARQAKDRVFNINQYIPIIFVNTFRYGLFDRNNIVLGSDINVRPCKNLKIYGQFALDDFHLKRPAGKGYQKTKFAFQGGLNYYHAFGLRNLHLQAEYNQARPYTYSHFDPLQSYTHYNQALAHPLGANFREALVFADYRWKRIYAQARFLYAISGSDKGSDDWGGDIFASDVNASNGYNSTGNVMLQGYRSTHTLESLTIGYLFNPRYQLCAEASLLYRNENFAGTILRNPCISLGIRTKLLNQYFDF